MSSARARALSFQLTRWRSGAQHRRTMEIHGLTRRENDVVTGVISGLSNRMIAMQLGISPRTVEAYRAQAMRKLGARSVAELVHIAMRERPGDG